MGASGDSRARGGLLRWAGVVGAAVALAGLLITPAADATVAGGSTPAGELATCGRPGQPRCPLQAWMRSRLAQPMAAGRLEDVARSLDALAARSPDPRWATWRSHAAEGAAAARRGDVSAVRQSCRSCHGAHRASYRELHRARPSPP